jgi:ABC-2 type transport system ATP-binding protein
VLVSSHLIAELSLFADDLVVIGGGRLLAAATVAEIANQAETSVLVESPQRAELAEILTNRGLGVADFDDRRLNVTGASRADIAQLALDHQIRLDELADQQASLEDLLVDLTHDAAEFTAA